MHNTKSRRHAPCGTISCFIRLLFSLAICSLLAPYEAKQNTFEDQTQLPKYCIFLHIDVVRRTEK